MSVDIPYKTGEVLTSSQMLIMAIFFIVVLIAIFLIRRVKPNLGIKDGNETLVCNSTKLSQHSVLHVITYRDSEIIVIESDKTVIQISDT